MKMPRMILCAVAVVSFAAFAAAQDTKAPQETKKPQAAAPSAEAMPPAPKPGPEHAVLNKDVGVWDATVESWMAPGQPPSVSKGTERNTITANGLWLITNFKSRFMGKPFQGHGVAGYDTQKKKYVSTWVDSMSTGLGIGEGTYDATNKTMTGWFEMPDPVGKMTKMKMVTEWKDADTKVFTMYQTGPDGKEQPSMRITYKRRK